MILTMFFSREVSLKDWDDTGILDREKLIYEEHLRRGNFSKVHWITYGPRDAELAAKLKVEGRLHPGIEVHSAPAWARWPLLGSWVYSFLSPFLRPGPMRECDILKTNQVSGSWSALMAKKRYKKPMLMRCGYIASIFAWKRKGLGIGAKLYEIAEKRGFSTAEAGVVASFEDRRFLAERYGIDVSHVRVLHNYIDTSLFKPLPGERRTDRLLFVGKFRRQKNVEALIRAAARLGLPIDIYGEGSLRPVYEALIRDTGCDATFHGLAPNRELPRIMAGYRYYVLPSFYEGTPKTLLEAMACGLCCVGTDVVGINEILTHGETGFLAEDTSPEALEDALRQALSDGAKAEAVGRRAAKLVEEKFSLPAWADREWEILQEIAGPRNAAGSGKAVEPHAAAGLNGSGDPDEATRGDQAANAGKGANADGETNSGGEADADKGVGA